MTNNRTGQLLSRCTEEGGQDESGLQGCVCACMLVCVGGEGGGVAGVRLLFCVCPHA